MGRSDPFVFKNYIDIFNNYQINNFKNVCFLGQQSENFFSNFIKSENKFYFDIKKDNWNINVFPYEIKRKYDLIVCTRCAYFSSNPIKFLSEIHNHLNSDGKIFIDWGLGDHFRHKNFKIGFKNSIEHESAYYDDNFLSSVYWDDEIMKSQHAKIFMKNCEKLGYSACLKEIVKKEVPSIVTESDITEFYKKIKVEVFTLWTEAPQLYIVTQMTKR